MCIWKHWAKTENDFFVCFSFSFYFDKHVDFSTRQSFLLSNVYHWSNNTPKILKNRNKKKINTSCSTICGAQHMVCESNSNNLCFSTENEQILRFLLFEIFGFCCIHWLCKYRFTAKCKGEPLPHFCFNFFLCFGCFCFERLFLFYCVIWTKTVVKYIFQMKFSLEKKSQNQINQN